MSIIHRFSFKTRYFFFLLTLDLLKANFVQQEKIVAID